MTREIALEILKSLDVYRGGDIDQAIQFAIKALEQEPCEDAISREATITFVCKNTKEILKDTMPLEIKLSDDYLYENVAKNMRNPKELPPVTPTHKKVE